MADLQSLTWLELLRYASEKLVRQSRDLASKVDSADLAARSMALLDWLTSAAGNPTLPWQTLKTKIAQDPYYRFQTLEEIHLAAKMGVQVDVNTATVDDWLRLPGLSIHQARLLVQLLESRVQFYCVEDIAAAIGVSAQRLQPLTPILRFCYYDPDSLDRCDRCDPNLATVETLQTLPSVGPALARAIVRHRTSHGDYRNLVDLQQRLNLPSRTIAELMHYLKF
ncbi:MAG: ComEA family DNA-binding protein [Synechococcales bacterium]|nr:ComEA family DNA-binding protein [Synechococcales bacterium]